MTTLALLALLLAPARAADPTPEQQVLYTELKVRDAPKSCALLSAGCADPVADFLFVVEHAEQPPWAGMRAASCLLELHAEAAAPHIGLWLQDPQAKGLALLTLQKLDDMPLTVADGLARAALGGPHADEARTRLAAASRDELRALVSP